MKKAAISINWTLILMSLLSVILDINAQAATSNRGFEVGDMKEKSPSEDTAKDPGESETLSNDENDMDIYLWRKEVTVNGKKKTAYFIRKGKPYNETTWTCNDIGDV